jgi:adenylate kinase
LLKDQLGVQHISSGDLFRFHLREGTALGQRVHYYVNEGLLVPDELTIDIVLDKVLDLSREDGFLLDGFPRTEEQALALERALREKSRGLDQVLFIDVPEDELVRRLGGRYICRECQAPHTVSEPSEAAVGCQHCGGQLYQREDDSPESVARRISVYQDQTLPVLDFYRQRGLLTGVPGVGEVERINRLMLAGLGQGA